jgi:hypothetical protein
MDKQQPTHQRGKMLDSPLRVVIVEPHHHALEEIHNVLRRERHLLGKSWSLCHIDAHPDLACPSNGIPAVACFRPRDGWKRPVTSDEVNAIDVNESACLYELLDSSTTGMSEWILPLVLAAGLHRMEWVKPADADVSEQVSAAQIPAGVHRFHVGAVEQPTIETDVIQTPKHSYMDLTSNATVMVDWDCLYYRDDDDIDFYVPHDRLHLSQPLELQVLEWSAKDSHNIKDMKEPWILDICLDYFYCINPFLQSIQSLDEELAKVSLDLVKLSKVYHAPASNEVGVDRDGLLCFRQCLKNCLQALAEQGDASDSSQLASILAEMTNQLEPFIAGEPRQAYSLLQRWKSLFMVHDKTTQHTLLTEILDSIPHALLPHSRFSSSPELDEYVSKSLFNFEIGLRRRLACAAQPPFLITIARSLLDGFTPSNIADSLQDKVISILHRLFCDSDTGCFVSTTCPSLQVVPQYTKNA